MDRLTVKWKDGLYDTFDPIDVIDNEYSKINYQKLINKLGQYEDEEEQGLLKILPVAIGSDVYFIPSKVNYELNVLNSHEENNRVYHQKVANIVFNERGWYLKCNLDLEYGVYHILVDKLYKETWFTSEEEAEQALKRMESE